VSAWIPDDRKYVPHPATWFNGGRYEDDPSTWARSAAQPNQGHGSPRIPPNIAAIIAAEKGSPA
jgi:hypothetical protein